MKYQEALKELPKIEKQIEGVMKVRESLYRGEKGITVSLATGKGEPEGLKVAARSIFDLDPLRDLGFGTIRPEPRVCDKAENIEISEVFAERLCDALLQILILRGEIF